MLNIIKSGFRSSGHERLAEEILHRVTSGERVLLIVPEQQTLLAEAEMADLLPPSAPLSFEVTNFTRLANTAARALGGISGEYCDKTKKSLIMWRTLTELSPILSSAGSKAVNEGLVSRYLSAIEQLTSLGIGAEELTAAAEREELSDNRLKAKLCDLGAVFSLYKRLLYEKYSDASDDCGVMLKKLREHPEYLSGYYVYIEGFTSFTETQYSIISELSSRLHLSVLMNISHPLGDSFEYTEVREAIERLKQKGRLGGSQVKITYEDTPKNPECAITRAGDLLWRTSAKKDKLSLQNSDEIRIFEARTPYEECEFVASDIKRRVIQGASYSDFAIVLRAEDKYRGILDTAFSIEGVPAFISRKKDAASYEAIKLIYTAYSALRSGFSRESVISYAKCALSGISRDECDELEYYAEKWKISGSRFTDGELWNMNPDGYSTVWRDGAAERVAKINEIRERLISPLSDFRDNTNGELSVRQHAELLVSFLQKISLPEALATRAELLSSIGEFSAAEETSRLWRLISDALDTLVEVNGELISDRDGFVGQLKICFSGIDIAKIPSYVDEVTVGSADMIRLYKKSHVYLIGVSEGEFPQSPSDNSYFTERDKEALLKIGLSLSPELEAKGARELYIFTRAFTYAEKTVTLSYSTRDAKYKSKERSAVIGRLLSLFDGELYVRKISELSAKESVWSKEKTLTALSELSEGEKEAAREALCEAGLSDMLIRAESSITNEALSFNPEALRGGLDTVSLTQSRIDSYGSCPLSYFCRYALSLSPEEPAEFDARNIGTFIHAILENVFREIAERGIDTAKLSKDERRELTSRAANQYLLELRDVAPNSEMTKIKISRLIRATGPVVDNLCDEFATSGFKPRFFELAIKRDAPGCPEPLTAKSEGGRDIFVYGYIDRVDTYEQGGDVYVRVVDYKTGAKAFSPEDIGEGKNLQMFLYLKSILDSKKADFRERLGATGGKVIPAGVIYVKTAINDTKIDYPDDELAEAAVIAAQKREGMVLDDERSLSAMGLKYTPVYDSKKPDEIAQAKRKFLFTEESFDKMMSDAMSVVGAVADGIADGNIKATPRAQDKHTHCDCCEFKPLCRAAVIK